MYFCTVVSTEVLAGIVSLADKFSIENRPVKVAGGRQDILKETLLQRLSAALLNFATSNDYRNNAMFLVPWFGNIYLYVPICVGFGIAYSVVKGNAKA